MSQSVRDGFQRRAVPKQARRRGLPQDARAGHRRRQAGASAGISNDVPDDVPGERPSQGPDTQEELSGRSRRSIPTEINRDGMAHGRWQWQRVSTARFAASDTERTGAPIDVIHGERRDIVGAEPEVEDTASDGVIASASGAATIERGEETAHVVVGQGRRQRRQRTGRWGWYGEDECLIARAVQLQKPEVAPATTTPRPSHSPARAGMRV